MEKRFVVFEQKLSKDGTGITDRFENVLAPETTEEEAVKAAQWDWNHLAEHDKRNTVISVALVEIDEDGIIDPDGKGYNPLWSSENK